MTRPDFELFITILAARRGLRVERMERALHGVPIQIIPAEQFAARREEAEQRMAQRDPEDVDLLALAMHLGLIIWTNDRDFEVSGLPVVSKAQLLAQCELIP